jgi:hypothetical protein
LLLQLQKRANLGRFDLGKEQEEVALRGKGYRKPLLGEKRSREQQQQREVNRKQNRKLS